MADRVIGVRRMKMLLLGLGGVALLLAIIGVFGIVSADAHHRRKEFAIRSALGAGPWAIRRRVVRSGLGPVPVGTLFGVLITWGALRVAELRRRQLPLGSGAGDPRPYIAISLLLLSTALVALLMAAYPAGRRDPLTSLREE